ncbi:protein phosphatase 2C domain-containing protein [Streptomyces sp. NPDC049585]|uniref:protein phosphatase 2C domain-containing protein n=1 Tax=Streptomyces sp. NPDC049585 TaxID=3155154 RepID=UPI00343DAEE3
MSQQGDQHAEQEDAWWRELYGRSESDTGGCPGGDSLDERFSSASAVVGPEPLRPRAEPRRPAPERGGPQRPGPRRGGPADEPPAPPTVAATGLSPALAGGVPRQTKRWAGPTNGSLPVPAASRHRPPPAPPDPEARPPAGAEERPEAPPPPDPRTRVSPPPPPPLPVPRETAAPVETAGPPAEVARITEATEVTKATEVPAGRDVPEVSEAADVRDVLGVRTVRDVSATAAGLRAGGVPEPEPVLRSRNGSRLRAAEFVGRRPPTYDPEPTCWPQADAAALEDLVPDTVLDGARYGTMTLRAASLRGDSARFRGEPRRDALLTARFGSGETALLLVAMASGARAAEGAHRAAREVCQWLAGAVGRSHPRLVEDIHAGRRDELKAGLHRLTDRTYGRLRSRAAELGLQSCEYTAALRCLLLPTDVRCRTRLFFGVGPGGLFRLREGAWQDLDPEPHEADPVATGADPLSGYDAADRLTVDLGIQTPGTAPVIDPEEVPGEPFRFRASIARPGDALLLCTAGLADPFRGEAELGVRLAERWAGTTEPPGLAEFLADVQLRVKGYADDRTACAVWEE